MIGYVTLGSNDVGRAAQFYDALLGELGASRMMESDTMVAWTIAPDQPGLGVMRPYDGNDATVGNGVMVALVVDSTDKVEVVDGPMSGIESVITTVLPGQERVRILMDMLGQEREIEVSRAALSATTRSAKAGHVT